MTEEQLGLRDSESLCRVVVLIPALNPEPALVQQIRRLMDLGFERVIVVNDGSAFAAQEVFNLIADIPGCDLLTHAVNLGKGRALKTGLNHFLLNYGQYAGLITVDADGQHSPDDAARVAVELIRNPRALVLGIRQFDGNTPWKSSLGNRLTRWFCALLVGRRLADTQCGLRGIPRDAIPALLQVPGEHYEYEMEMLAGMYAPPLKIIEQPISTIYIDGNRASHFRPVFD